jgi:hypothetical protein
MSLVVIGASANIARVARTLGEPLIFVQQPGARVRQFVRDDVDELFPLDFREESGLAPFAEQILRPRAPKAVVSVTEQGLEPAAILSALLGTPGTPLEVVRAMRDKLTMRRVLAERAGHLNVDFADPSDEAAVARLFTDHERVIVKPVRGTASENVRTLRSSDELRSCPDLDRCLLEEFVDGPEFSVESFSAGGEHSVVAIAEKGTEGNFVEVSHVVPPVDLKRRQVDLIDRAVRDLLDALGLRDGPAHTELKLVGDTVRIIETHNRPGGDGIADLVAITAGFDWRRVCLGWPLGVRPEPGVPQAAAAAITFFTAEPGKVVHVQEPRQTFPGAAVQDWAIDVAVGDSVDDLRSSRDRVGWATLAGESPEACLDAIQALRSEPVVRTEEGEVR